MKTPEYDSRKMSKLSEISRELKRKYKPFSVQFGSRHVLIPLDSTPGDRILNFAKDAKVEGKKETEIDVYDIIQGNTDSTVWIIDAIIDKLELGLKYCDNCNSYQEFKDYDCQGCKDKPEKTHEEIKEIRAEIEGDAGRRQ